MSLFGNLIKSSLTGGGTKTSSDPLKKQRDKKKPEKPKKTAQEVALETRQSMALDEEIEESEDKFAALARGRMGPRSLLAGSAKTARGRATKKSMLPTSSGGNSGVRSGARSIPSNGARV